MATVITNLFSAIPFIGKDLVTFIWGAFSVANPTIQRFFALHYLCPFILAALVLMHLMALHAHGSTNPLGISNNIDRLPFHGYFVFKDLVTVFLLLLIFCLFVFFSPNTLGQGRPIFNISTLYSIITYAICWKYFSNYNKTNIISDLIFKIYANPKLVKYYYNKYNQQITNIIYNYLFILLVGISETTRIHKYINNRTISTFNKYSFKINNKYSSNIKFNQWLAGLIDGDGYLGITQKKYTTCEITVGIEDEKMLRQIQNKFKGSIKLRSGAKTLRYRLNNKEDMIKLINAINGNIRHSKRLIQLEQVCNILNIKCIKPYPLDINNSWFAGFFDADGTINYYYQNNRPQLFISVTNKYLNDVQPYMNIIGGKIYFDKSQNGNYKWVLSNETNHMLFYNYIMNNNLSRSNKGKRIYLLKEFYYYYNLKAYINKNELIHKSWLLFETKWKNIQNLI